MHQSDDRFIEKLQVTQLYFFTHRSRRYIIDQNKYHIL